MLTFVNGMDIRCREVSKPQIAKFHVNSTNIEYCIIGTDYGYIHTSGGDVRTWKSASGARKWLKSYLDAKRKNEG